MDPIKSSIFLLGGYGGVGQKLAEHLLLAPWLGTLVIAGRSLDQARRLVANLQARHPHASILARKADASNAAALAPALQDMDLLVVCTPTPEWAGQLGQAALRAHCDYVDLFISPSAREQLLPLVPQMGGRHVITQAGFHPGILAPLMRHLAAEVEGLKRVRVGLSMNQRFERASSAREIVREAYDFRARVYKDGHWKQAGLGDSITLDFGTPAGRRACVPLNMEETWPLVEELELEEMGVYVSGFNWFVDWVVFSAIYLAGKVKPGLWARTFERLLKWGMDTFSPREPWVAIRLEGVGNTPSMGSQQLSLMAKDGYLLTATCVMSLLRQLQAGDIPAGLHLMGDVVHPSQLILDLTREGLALEVTGLGATGASLSPRGLTAGASGIL